MDHNGTLNPLQRYNTSYNTFNEALNFLLRIFQKPRRVHEIVNEPESQVSSVRACEQSIPNLIRVAQGDEEFPA